MRYDQLPIDKSYLESDIPDFLKASIDKMKGATERVENGENYLRYDCNFCELQSEINVAEVAELYQENKRGTYARNILA